ncbi:MAG: hypothetical protein GXO67_05325, partial [Archaeoglobi archaeon]|nr:hypothetical protein [Archaeoglobi archaeon]
MTDVMDEVEKYVALERTRTLSEKLELAVKIAAVLIGIYEILFIFNFTYSIYDVVARLGY